MTSPRRFAFRHAVRSRSSVRAWQHTLGSRPAVGGLSPDDFHSVQAQHCRRRGNPACQIVGRVRGGMRRQPVCCRADRRDRRQDRYRARKSVHVPGMICIRPIAPFRDCARTSPALSTRITDRIQCSGTAKRLDASVTNAAKGSIDKDRSLDVWPTALVPHALHRLTALMMLTSPRCTPSSREIARLPSCSRPSRVKR